MVYITEWYRKQKFRQIPISYWDQKHAMGLHAEQCSRYPDIQNPNSEA
jgi:hypothetical protein